jgi:hypothetical protein
MFTAYLDDSGTAPDQPIALCVALIIPGSQILNLERQWEAFRTKQGFDDFYASECAYSDSKRNSRFAMCRFFGVGIFEFGFRQFQPKTDASFCG